MYTKGEAAMNLWTGILRRIRRLQVTLHPAPIVKGLAQKPGWEESHLLHLSGTGVVSPASLDS